MFVRCRRVMLLLADRGVTYFHGCYSVDDDTLLGVNRRRKGATLGQPRRPH
ncbi:hypothetical protein [Streptomyces cyaneofuscatus]